jgi:transcriptional regulator with XRE-family HTH domain
MARKRVKLSDQIRRAVESSGKSRYAIFKATGIDQATLSRFMSGQYGLPMKTLDRLADFLDLSLATSNSGTAKKGK